MSGNIVFDGVWKRFHRGPAHDSLRDLVPALLRRTAGRDEDTALGGGDFWAVKDVSFEVQPGHALGIIGGNGAGKSTILKLLTRVLTPNLGHASIEGRVGALIEVSAGFHGDLSGRENVFLQGAIMGMPQQLIRERFDDIVEFSGVSAFIDTPVKRYSSGMNARLGFSIAVHLEPDALIIDEVLSVGDAEFQARAFERVRGLVKQNVPVVLVSHQLDRVVELCTECILLQSGEVAFRGAPSEAVHRYMHGGANIAAVASDAQGPIKLLSLTRDDTKSVRSGETCHFEMQGEVVESPVSPAFVVAIQVLDASSGVPIFITDLRVIGAHPTQPGLFKVPFDLQMNVAPGLYRIETFLWDEPQMRKLGSGPSMLVDVQSGMPFGGSHQLNIGPVYAPGQLGH